MDDRLLRALRREPLDRPPVWFMRQAGRYLPAYRKIRSDRSFLDVVQDPEAAAEITCLPFQHLDLDAAVIYADLSTPYLGAGIDVEMRKGVGPYVADTFTTPADLDRLAPYDPREELPFLLEAIERVTARLDVPVVGFVGAPFTLCSYLVEAPRTRRLEGLKRLMWTDPGTWEGLMGYWADQLAEVALAQHEAGASVIQVFDSWAGMLAPADYQEHVLPHSRRLLTRLGEEGVPTIHFAQGNPGLLGLVSQAGGDAVSVDWRLPLDEAWDAVGHDRAIQGNLDPVALLAGEDVARGKAQAVLDAADGRPGHVFNLGHGILPGTDVEVVRAVVDEVQAAAEAPR